MTRLLPLLILLFIFLPYDAQLWALGIVRSIPAEFWFGAVGATLTGMIWYGLGWNGLAKQMYTEDVTKAEEGLRRRRR